MVPNPVSDQAVNSRDLHDPIRQMLLLLPALIDSLEANHPRIIRSNLATYLDELRSHRNAASWGGLDRLMSNAETSFKAADEREFDPGLRDQFGQCFEFHRHLMGALRDADKRHNTLTELEIDEGASGDVIAEPVKMLEEAADELKSAGLTEDSFDRGIDALVEQGKEEQFPPPLAEAPEPRLVEVSEEAGKSADLDSVPVPAVSSRKRWLVGTITVAKETYNLLGSTASLASLPVVVMAMDKLAMVIEKLLRLIH